MTACLIDWIIDWLIFWVGWLFNLAAMTDWLNNDGLTDWLNWLSNWLNN